MRTRNWGEQGAASLGILEREAARVIAETGKRPECGRRDSPAERGGVRGRNGWKLSGAREDAF